MRYLLILAALVIAGTGFTDEAKDENRQPDNYYAKKAMFTKEYREKMEAARTEEKEKKVDDATLAREHDQYLREMDRFNRGDR